MTDHALFAWLRKLNDRLGENLTEDQLRSEPVNTLGLNQLVPVQYDEITLSYTSGQLTTVTYQKDSIPVAVLTLGYTDGDLTSVSRS